MKFYLRGRFRGAYIEICPGIGRYFKRKANKAVRKADGLANGKQYKRVYGLRNKLF